MSKKNLRIVWLIFSVFTLASAQAQGQGGPPSGVGNSIDSKLAALEARIAKLEGQITMSDLAGTYVLHGFQTELRARTQDGVTRVSSYVFQGVTVVLNADGTGSVSGGSETGHGLDLCIGVPCIPFRGFFNDPAGGAPFNFTWSYANGVVSWSIGSALNVAAGGRVLVTSGANPADGTTVLLILARLQ